MRAALRPCRGPASLAMRNGWDNGRAPVSAPVFAGRCWPQRLVYSRSEPPSGLRCFCAPDAMSSGESDQADVSAQEALPAKDPWVSCPHGDSRRPAGDQGTAPEGSQTPDSRSATVNRRHRLRGRGRFAAVRASGVETRSGGIRVRAAANGLPVSRAGFAIVSAPHAVARNRLRRRLRALVAPIVSHHPGVDIVVSAPAALDAVAANALRDAVVPLVSGAIAEARGR